MKLSDARQLVIARRLRRQADGARGQIDFLRQTPASAGVLAMQTSAATIASLRASAANLDQAADLLDPARVTVGR